eukprot:GFUD01025318.1.p1 GENE.GFUD01025318.1~~GFUD01025318.1.p1  ORF type:complete len:625 (-),score=155.76 GFUD01025318.1:86-1960(-)
MMTDFHSIPMTPVNPYTLVVSDPRQDATAVQGHLVKMEMIEEETADEAETFPNFVFQAGKQKSEEGEVEFKVPTSKTVNRSKDKKVTVTQSVSQSVDGVNNKSLKRKKFYREESLHLVCEWDDCCDTADRMEDFMRHVAIHVREAEVRHNPPPLKDVFACLWAECGFETFNSEEMIRHIHFHSFHTKIKCHGKNMLVTNGLLPCKLDSAQKNILPDLSDPFKCEWEGCEFGEEDWQMPQNFYWHVKDHPEDVRGMDIKCRWRGCPKADTAVSKLKEHMRCHSQERMIGCPTCGGLFANRIKFFDHCLRQQVSEHSFTCINCSKKFAIERHLRDHMRSHINHYKCPQCDMTCPTPSTLTNHIRYRHTTEKPFACEFCSYRGKTPADVKSHLRVHYKEVEMKCPEEGCQFSCRAKITMKQHHLAVHTKNLPLYACHLCEMRYDRGAYLTKHLVKTHSFSWPSGHSRFRYTKDSTTGLFRLQTIRFESLDLQQEIQGASAVSGRSMDFGPLSVDFNPLSVDFNPLSVDFSPLSVDSVYSDWDSEMAPGSVQSCPPEGQLSGLLSCDQFGPLSVQSCPELESSAQLYQDMGPWSVQPSGLAEHEQAHEDSIIEEREFKQEKGEETGNT